MKLLLLLSFVAFAFQTPQANPEAQAWDAAQALKNKAAYTQAAEAWEKYAESYPQAPRARQALVEAGVSWFSEGRAKQVLQRNTPKSDECMEKARALFDRVCSEAPKDPLASRARHMRGSTYLFSGQLAEAELAYTSVLELYAQDRSYVEKALEYRSMARRHLLDSKGAIADMERFLKDFPQSQRKATVQAELALARTLGLQAPVYQPEQWVFGEPAPLELLGGQVVALYFWATWCPNCAKVEPYMIDLAKRFGPKGVAVVGVTDHQQNQTPVSIAAHAKAKGYSFPSFQDSGLTSTSYKAGAIPFLVLIDRHGKIRWADNPADLHDDTLERLLREE